MTSYVIRAINCIEACLLVRRMFSLKNYIHFLLTLMLTNYKSDDSAQSETCQYSNSHKKKVVFQCHIQSFDEHDPSRIRGLPWEHFGLVVCSLGILMCVSLLCYKTCEMTFILGSRYAAAGCSPWYIVFLMLLQWLAACFNQASGVSSCSKLLAAVVITQPAIVFNTVASYCNVLVLYSD